MAKKSRVSEINNIKNWSTIRRRILERDNYQCRICGKDGAESKLNVHHIDYNRDHNVDSNLVTLCSKCHHLVHMENYKPDLYEDWPVPWGNI